MNVSIQPALKSLRTAALIALVAVVGVFMGYFIDFLITDNPEVSAPEQPIAFSHKIHAGDNEIPCQYCHTEARRSPSAGVPSVNKCMGCHNEVATDSPLIRQVSEYWENKEPIPWVKVHDLPDFVHFTHKRHVQAGIACQTCHGPVEPMDKIAVHSRDNDGPTLMASTTGEITNSDTSEGGATQNDHWEMGLCLNCHKQHDVVDGKAVRVDDGGFDNGLDCWTCHK